MVTTATIKRSKTITIVAVGTISSIFLRKINYLPGAIHVSLKYFSLLLFGIVCYFVWDFLHMICNCHLANKFGIDFAALF